ncbi:phosphoribosylaminoimidazolesuccinocarboxamide synthase [Acidiferrobacter thiooxydans]|uniref:Phosphoribosylaminoimidazole-succinocarboxamide synthase n=1 Tax=Acidiferrobacter thiooxydans TaxID=163359 RepID=A0A368HEA3_9GAMM|nr:phosphoribosylaminoimidazolesuccinocarboxamide synthase [Acidiferrobacter thiooxydans]MDA8190662.1 phosphoribosylaminoimidazolesuccinocarboxamide synthase [Gammaproteobacteria bacterium]RCN55850.1 phosphoribosylaminoimidazolesuccinocarboxamide synthase [Acidiferrobacter thiooxydans]
MSILYESALHLPLLHRGKVRDLYDAGPEHLLVVTTDRLSAFDCVLPDPIPGKGRILNALSGFWFARTQGIVANHLSDRPLASVLPDAEERALVADRAMVVRRLKPLPIEAIVRGYLAGSGWKEYRRTGTLCGIVLPPGLREAERLPQALFTPSTKAAVGAHDENIDYAQAEALLGAGLARAVRDASLRLYAEAAAFAAMRGIIIADTKFEFAVDERDRLVLIDEVLTPDSSRFWPQASYRPGTSPPSYDKQYVRDYLETLAWDKRPPAPRLPAEVVAQTVARYEEALRVLTAVGA